MVRLALILLALLLPQKSFAAVEKKEFPAKEINALVLDNSAGTIKITTTDSNTAIVSADKTRFGKDCELTIKHSKRLYTVCFKSR